MVDLVQVDLVQVDLVQVDLVWQGPKWADLLLLVQGLPDRKELVGRKGLVDSRAVKGRVAVRMRVAVKADRLLADKVPRCRVRELACRGPA